MSYNNRTYRLIKVTPLIALLLLIPVLAFAAQKTLQAKVMKVSDGDTIVVSPIDGGNFFKCRLYGIDTPEGSQTYGDEATKALKHLILAQVVEIQTTGDITYRREVCHVTLNGVDVNLEMVRLGHAWAYRKYLKKPYKALYVEAETEAKSKRLGLWKDDNPVPPWDYREAKRNGNVP
jgi:endonuclease YncB( thermonuclease family)